MKQKIIQTLLGGLLISSSMTFAAESTVAGEFIIEPPTLLSLGFEWLIDGDDNRNASVSVEYRQAGTVEWQQGPPLLRIGNERINENALQYVTPAMFAGSVFDLQADTRYVARLTMSDPDGISGQTERLVSVTTRAEPMPAAGGNVYHAYPPGYEGEMLEPALPVCWAPITPATPAPIISIPTRPECSPAIPCWCTRDSIKTTVTATRVVWAPSQVAPTF